MNDPYASELYYDYPLILKQLLHAPISINPDQEIVSGFKFRYNYKNLRERISRLATGLSSLGIKSGDTVGVMNWDCHRYLECFFSIPMMGAILHTINIRLSPQQILYTINHAQDDIILVHSDFLPLIRQISKEFTRSIKIVLLCDEELDYQNYEIIDEEYETLLKESSHEFDFLDFNENSLATRFYTTGTTGDPKGVSYSHRQLVLHTLGVIAGTGVAKSNSRIHKEDVYMPITPMFHVHGWGFPYVATLLGLKQVYPGKYNSSKILKLIKDEKVTFSHCVPTILKLILDDENSKNVNLSNLKMIIGGSALPKGLAKNATDRGINVFSAYGMSETCPFVTVADIPYESSKKLDDALIELRCKTGKPAPLVEVRVVDEHLKDIPKGGKLTGEIILRSPWLTKGYVKDQNGSNALWKGGYLHTGDIGYLDETGSLQITDRMKDVIKSGGEWISSLELENIVSKCIGIREVAAIGIPDEKWGERPILIFSCDKGKTYLEVETGILELIKINIEKGNLSKWAKPDRIIMVDEIDKTSVGKIDKKLLRKKFSDIKIKNK